MAAQAGSTTPATGFASFGLRLASVMRGFWIVFIVGADHSPKRSFVLFWLWFLCVCFCCLAAAVPVPVPASGRTI